MNKKQKILLIVAGVIIIPVLISPLPRFKDPLSTVVEARDGTLLGARIAEDGQWRFPASSAVPEKFEKALLTFEDKYFYFHPGINPVAFVRAFRDNLKAKKIVSGGSTITMQVARLSRKSKPRTYPEKIIEILQAVKLEIFRSKKNILKMYTSNAPFGGNIVGLDAAAWRYTGKTTGNITWAEAAAFAVLPNSPSLVYPGKNQELLKNRRNELLKKLFEREYFDSLTLVLSLDEPVPGEYKPLPSISPHITDLFFIRNKGERIRTTIDPELQERAAEFINSNQKQLSENFIFNSAAIIVDVPTGEVLAYIGNSTDKSHSSNGNDVDLIGAKRSTGSILKPLLYAGMLGSGEILPNTLIPDIPIRYPGFTPKNFDQSYSGAVQAGSALSQSLNIPAVGMLKKYTEERFLELLKTIGFKTFDKPADHYGLSLILGGGETSLWELTGVYASLSRTLRVFNDKKKYFRDNYHPPVLIIPGMKKEEEVTEVFPPLSAASIWLTYEALKKVNRPETETGWQYFSSTPELAWKTGTSFGFRDAWAVGTTPDYVIGVWAGNADGEGRPGLTGITAAAPILFRLVGLMKSSRWFTPPYEELTAVTICKQSGYRAGPDCRDKEEIQVCINGLRSEVCPFHRIIHLNKTASKQVTADCVPVGEIINESWFVLPPAMEFFYRQKHPEYKPLPPFETGCKTGKDISMMEFIYPTQGIRIFIPRDQTGELTRVISEIVHRIPSKKVFWHLDEKYFAATKYIHQAEIYAAAGKHLLTIVDEDGNTIKCSFYIMKQ